MGGKLLLFYLYIGCMLSYIVNGLVCSNIQVTNTSQTIDSHTLYGSSDYPNKYERCWILTAEDSSKVVGLSMVDFDVQKSEKCKFDKLSIYNSNTQTNSGKKGKYCGTENDIFTHLYSSSKYMYLKFDTNSNTRKDGFRFFVKQYDKAKYDPELWSPITGNSSSTKEDGGLSGGIIAGIVVGSLGTATICYICIKKKEEAKKAQAAANNRNPQPPAAGGTSNSSSRVSPTTSTSQTTSTTQQATTVSSSSSTHTTAPSSVAATSITAPSSVAATSITAPSSVADATSTTTQSSTAAVTSTTASSSNPFVNTIASSVAVILPPLPPPTDMPPAYTDLFMETTDPFGVPLPPIYYPEKETNA